MVVVLRERRLGLLPPQMFWSFNISTVAVKAATSGNQARGWYFPAHGIHRPWLEQRGSTGAEGARNTAELIREPDTCPVSVELT